MNNYIKVFAASVLSFMVVSCSLDEVNYSAESSEEYIKDETQYEEAGFSSLYEIKAVNQLYDYGFDVVWN